MQEHPAVSESLAFGFPDPRVQEIVTAVVVLNQGFKSTKNLQKGLIQFVNGRVAYFKQIRGGIIFQDSLPRNSMGKLVRKEMRDWAKTLQN